MYRLEAVIGPEPVLRAVVGSIREARVVALDQHLSMLPMTDELFAALTVAGAPELGGFRKAPAGSGRVLADCSVTGPVAYVEAEYFGGLGSQSAQVWDGGRVVLEGTHVDEEDSAPAEDSPISRALRRLGATRGERIDEFDAVGLGRHRDTDDWLPGRA
jgi:hypothetical protein